jgi:hypothetical protein
MKTHTDHPYKETRGVDTVVFEDLGLTFNAEPQGPANFYNLRNADYSGFEMATFPELIPLIQRSLQNDSQPIAKNIAKTFRKRWVRVDTGVLYTPEGIFVQDNPQLSGNRIVMDESDLQSRLGSHQEGSVVFSDDKTVRFTPYDFKTGAQTSLDLSKNNLVIALAKGEENAHNLAETSQQFRNQPYLWSFSKNDINEPVTRVAALDSGWSDDWLDVYGDYLPVDFDGVAFGVDRED